MKAEHNILIAFLLNISFSIFEFFGGVITGSVSIMSDAMHDLGDAIAMGISYFLECKSRQQPDEIYTYGYVRYSVLGSILVSGILVFGSVIIVYNAIGRILHPVSIDYNGMILFAIVGVALNFLAAYITHKGDSLNQKAVNLHMLEDMLGWIVVLVGGVIMRYTDISILDPILSICVALFILFHAVQNLKEVLCIFLEKAPCGLSAKDIKHYISSLDGISD
ncbi:MAG: cation transporter, partial [Selenomonadales bacterium]|nr:cation transporter [Selenomonadales bacterium]